MKLTPVKAIRAKCLDCVGEQPKEVRLCPSENCPLYPYRMGHRPKEDEGYQMSADVEKPQEAHDF